MLFGLHLLRSFLRDVLAAEVFTAKNARRLSSLGCLLVFPGAVWPLLEFAYMLFVVRRAGLSRTSLGIGISDFEAVLPGLLVPVVATAWRYGVELQRDRDPTV